MRHQPLAEEYRIAPRLPATVGDDPIGTTVGTTMDCRFTGKDGVFVGMTIEILRRATSRARLSTLAETQFGDMVKPWSTWNGA